jgi:hypothetical protein
MVSQDSFFYTGLVELSIAHPLKEKLRFCHLTNSINMQNKKILQSILNTLGNNTVM